MEKKFIVMYHGGICPNRGIEQLIDAVAMNGNVFAVILGDGSKEYIDKLILRTVDRGINDKILFQSAVPQSELWKYIGAVDLEIMLIQPAVKSYFYSLPNKFFESIQSMTPMLTSDFPEMRHLIDKYAVGEYCDPQDVESINKHIEHFRTNPVKMDEYRANLKRAKEELCWEKESNVLKEAYINRCGLGQNAKAVKLVPSDFKNESRDKREIRVMEQLGWSVKVACLKPFYDKSNTDYEWVEIHVHELSSKQPRLVRYSLILLNEIHSIMQIRKMEADIISCHDLDMLRLAWLSGIFKKRPMLIYDSHEYELERNTIKKRSSLKKGIIALEEKFLMKRCKFSMMVNETIAKEVQKNYGLSECPIVVRNMADFYAIDDDVVMKQREKYEKCFEKEESHI